MEIFSARFALLATLCLSGCATPYNRDMGLTGGSEVSMVTPTRAVVSFRGNGYTSSDRVQQYVMLRAAELTIDKGYGHFAILNTTDDSTDNTLYTGFLTFTQVHFPKERLEIEMFPGGKPMNAAHNVFNAADIINTVRPTLEGSSAGTPAPVAAPAPAIASVPVVASPAVMVTSAPLAQDAISAIATTAPTPEAAAQARGLLLPPVPTQTEKLPGHRVAGYGCPGFAPRVLYAESPDKLPKACERMEPL